MKALATFVDSLVSTRAGHVAENALPAVSVIGLQAALTRQLLEHLQGANLAYRIVDEAEQVLERDALDTGVAPFSVTFSKPVVDGIVCFLSTQAFGTWLRSPVATSSVWVAACAQGFATEAFTVGGWGDIATPIPALSRKSPRNLVRDASGRSLVPPDLRPFLLADGTDKPAGDPVFEVWAALAAEKLILSLATEVLSDDRVEFLGPPRLTIARFDSAKSPELVDWLEPLQDVARWVYDLEREVDLRHRLFTQEFARLAYGETEIGNAFSRCAAPAIEGAKIAYSFHLQEISKDALKSLSDLRKTVAEDTQKNFEGARQVALSAAGALFYAVGVVATKMSATLDPAVFDVLLLVGMTYIGSVVAVCHRAIRQQVALRTVWRSKIYRYLTDGEYKEMVDSPTRRAERLLRMMLWCVVLVSSVVFDAAAWFL